MTRQLRWLLAAAAAAALTRISVGTEDERRSLPRSSGRNREGSARCTSTSTGAGPAAVFWPFMVWLQGQAGWGKHFRRGAGRARAGGAAAAAVAARGLPPRPWQASTSYHDIHSALPSANQSAQAPAHAARALRALWCARRPDQAIVVHCDVRTGRGWAAMGWFSLPPFHMLPREAAKRAWRGCHRDIRVTSSTQDSQRASPSDRTRQSPLPPASERPFRAAWSCTAVGAAARHTGGPHRTLRSCISYGEACEVRPGPRNSAAQQSAVFGHRRRACAASLLGCAAAGLGPPPPQRRTCSLHSGIAGSS